jgi:hypothetical protein
MIGRISDRAIHASAAEIIPDLVDPRDAGWARTTALQLSALAQHASRRPEDPSASAEAEVRSALADAAVPGAEGDDPWERAAEVLRSAVLGGAAGTDVRAQRDALRAVLVRQLDDALAGSMELMDAFRGKPARG